MDFAATRGPFERRSAAQAAIAYFIASPTIVKLAILWLAMILFIAVTARWIMPYDYQQTALLSRLLPPGATGPSGDFHLLGTDHLGRDLLSRLFSSIQLTMLVAVFGTFFGAVVGSCIGFVAARFRGWVDDIIMVLVDFQASMPFVIIALSVIAVMGTGNMLLFILLVGFQGWERYARICRGMTLSAVNHGYAAAIRLLGAGTLRVYLRHILAEHPGRTGRPGFHQLSRNRHPGNIHEFPGCRNPAPQHVSRQPAELRAGLSPERVVDCRRAGMRNILHDIVHEHHRRLAARCSGSNHEQRDLTSAVHDVQVTMQVFPGPSGRERVHCKTPPCHVRRSRDVCVFPDWFDGSTSPVRAPSAGLARATRRRGVGQRAVAGRVERVSTDSKAR